MVEAVSDALLLLYETVTIAWGVLTLVVAAVLWLIVLRLAFRAFTGR